MIEAALKKPYVIFVMALIVIVVGVTSYQKIPADLPPVFKTPAVQIVTFYPGMPPEVMERDMMSRLECWTGQSRGHRGSRGPSDAGCKHRGPTHVNVQNLVNFCAFDGRYSDNGLSGYNGCPCAPIGAQRD